MDFYPYKILDPIHGFIRFNKLEEKVIDSLYFQRLRYIHQIGVVYLVYPGAHHTRFEHSLGVMEFAGRIFDALVARREHSFDLKLSQEELFYWRSIVRLAALCHDIGHLPFSHVAEKTILGRKGHERMSYHMLRSKEFSFIKEEWGEKALDDVIKLAIDDEVLRLLAPHLEKSPLERLFSKIVSDDNFGADRVDYLIRDAYYTGVGYGHFDYHQLIDSLRILSCNEQWTMGIVASGIQSVESLWIARYMMYARVYKHDKSCLYSAHMERYMSKLSLSLELPYYTNHTDYTVLSEMALSQDEDAHILLKKERPYKIITLSEKEQKGMYEYSQSLKEHFGNKILCEIGETEKSPRNFWICRERGDIVSSEEYSSFVHTIPLGVKSIELFAHASIYEEVQNFLRSKCS